MRVEERAISDTAGTVLMHNIADKGGKRILRKGILLTEEHIAQLAVLDRPTVHVAVLETDDVHEDEAAVALATALKTQELYLSRPSGGRVNLRAEADGLLEIDADRLLELNMLPGITLATRRQHLVVGPNQDTDNVGTLKIIPYAVHRKDLERALALAEPRPGIVEIRPLQQGRRAALLLIGEPAVHEKLRDVFEPPTRARLGGLGAALVTVEGVTQDEAAIGQAAARLVQATDLLIIAGQTSIMDEEDTTLRALRRAGAEMTLSGAPVEPGNLLALAFFPDTPVLCAPGCARGLKRNVVDLVLPRLLLGDRLDRRDIAALGLGGFLTRAERAGDLVIG
jgi:molybdenum cofactor cytidylyltransferase